MPSPAWASFHLARRGWLDPPPLQLLAFSMGQPEPRFVKEVQHFVAARVSNEGFPTRHKDEDDLPRNQGQERLLTKKAVLQRESCLDAT
jgi:hypothetical protein